MEATQEFLVEFLACIASTDNMPSLTKVWFDFETLRKLTAIPDSVGLKDSSGDLAYFEKALELKKLRPDWSVMIGPEAKLPEAMRLRGDGGVDGGGV